MNRKDFLTAIGMTSFVAYLAACAKNYVTITKNDCGDTITPPVPEGPYYKDEQLNRSDITEGLAGVPITYIFKVEDSHCQPIQDAIVDIWQCNKEGVYSDFSAQNTSGQKWLRGFQKTGADGKCTFKSIFPGWYSGRLTHLHGKLHVNGVTKDTTNFFYPKAIETEVYKNQLYTKGQNSTSVSNDIELKGDTGLFDALMMSVVADGNGGYIATYTISYI